MQYSHILPEFIYKPLYDSDHEFVEVASEGRHIKGILAKGVREHLLCRLCEKRFSKYEDHAARAHREMRRRLDTARVGDLVTVPANYTQLKLFQLSLLWRAAVSKDPIFHAAQAEAFEPKLRELLLHEMPGTIYTSHVSAWHRPIGRHLLQRLRQVGSVPSVASPLSGLRF